MSALSLPCNVWNRLVDTNVHGKIIVGVFTRRLCTKPAKPKPVSKEKEISTDPKQTQLKMSVTKKPDATARTHLSTKSIPRKSNNTTMGSEEAVDLDRLHNSVKAQTPLVPTLRGYETKGQSVTGARDSGKVQSGFRRPAPISNKDLENDEFEVEGAESAWLLKSELHVDNPDLEVTGDLAYVVVVDTGDDEEYGLYISVVPLGAKKLAGQQQKVSGQLKVE